MPSVAEVQFKATGQQTVVSAFNSVGTSADGATQKVNQNSSAMKSMGTGMKSSVSGIASAASAFATLSLSVVNTWRAYRDLTDAQIAVDKANLRVAKTTEAIRKSEAEVAAIKKESGKGSLESIAFTNKMRLAQQKLDAARKDGKHTAAELAVMQDNINLAQKEGSGTSKKLTDAENKLALQKEQLGVQTDVAKEAQERFNDTQQNFYLSILPTALSGFASLSMAFSGLKGMLSGGGGLIGMFGPLGIAIGAISIAVIAFQTNFLGLRDKIGGVITWFKERFGAWKDTIQEVFGFIQKGDWAGAFNRIKQAAQAFWEDLKKTVPFFGTVNQIIEKIRNGDWHGAFHTIAVAATQLWADLKKSVPFFGAVEDIINKFRKGDWKGAFDSIVQQAKNAATFIFGEDFVQQVEGRFKRIEAASNLAISEIKNGDWKGAFGAIHSAVEQTGAIDATNLIEKLGIGPAGILAAIKDPKQRANWANIGTEIGKQLTNLVSGIIDPFVASLLTPAAWTTAISKASAGLTGIATALIDAIFPKDKKTGDIPAATAAAGSFVTSFFTGVGTWISANTKQTQAAFAKLITPIQEIGTGAATNFVDFFVKGIPAAVTAFADQIMAGAGSIGQKIIEGIQGFFKGPDWLKFPPITVPPITPPPPVPITGDTKPLIDSGKKGATTVSSQKPVMKVGANVNGAINTAIQARNKINNMKATIQVNAHFNAGTLKGFSANARLSQHGTNTVVKRPTMFIAGEGGRPESVRIKPRGSAGSDGGGSGFNGTINVYVDGVLQRARFDITKFQGVMK